MSRERGRRLLAELADHLYTVPPENFDMGTCCDTVACAAGHAMTLPSWRAAGFKSRNKAPAFHGCWGYEALAVGLGIGIVDARGLFGYFSQDNWRYRDDWTPIDAAENIRLYLLATEDE